MLPRRTVRFSARLSGKDRSPRGPPYTTHMADASISCQSPLRPIYRVLDTSGEFLDPSQDPGLSEEVLLRLYRKMTLLNHVDQQMYKAQRMGIISFYMTSYGEEGIQFGSAAALDPDDVVYAQYREPGVIMWRGFTLDNLMDQCFSNKNDRGRGRQMPIHYGSKELNFNFVSSPVATQMSQAPGYAYGLKLSGSKNCVIVYFGDGAAQTGDSHAAMNFAATLRCPVIFMCRNNGYAISTPVHEQYAGDGIVNRGLGYGMEAIRVDGNDIFAVYNVTKHARDVCVSEHRPVLIEAMTYRLGSHSTSDDQTAYQDMKEVEHWWKELHPTKRLKNYLIRRNLWDEERDKELVKIIENDIKASRKRASEVKKPPIDEMFNDVYDQLPVHLQRQRKDLREHIKRYKDHYPLDKHEQS